MRLESKTRDLSAVTEQSGGCSAAKQSAPVITCPSHSTFHFRLASNDNGSFCSSQAVLQVPVLIQAPEDPE